MTVYTKLAEVDAKVAELESNLGLPHRINLLARHQTYNTVTKSLEVEDILITPKARITPVSPKLVNLQISVEGADSIFITINDMQVELPRTVSKDTILKPESNTKVRFYINPPLDVNGDIIYTPSNTKNLPGEYVYRLIFLDESSAIRWRLILTRERDKKK
jgi:hypothetical protein